jgi:uncharacterized protein
MKNIYAVLALFLLVPAFAISQSTAVAPAPASDDAALAAPVPLDQQPSKEDLNKLFEVMHLREQMQNVMKMMPQMIQQQLQQQWKQTSAKYGGQLTPDQEAGLEKLMQKYMTQAMNVYNVDDMISDMIPVYQRHFTKDDVHSLTAFYSTPAGQHMLALQPVIMKEYMPVVMKRVQESSAQLTDELANDMAAYMKSIAPASGPDSK